ncbi:hypothetical protein Purlil1_10486 [Purpureocillium lilacinum]|uniref:Uncharacterized protein n=1 Tax=Purpureocillium lilacinum TaxID=33203 RepID=A0ABR0BM84_PURLI|nr:hypothetical protein Purlil1_10486 [Purpureocillium lilacinum]
MDKSQELAKMYDGVADEEAIAVARWLQLAAPSGACRLRAALRSSAPGKKKGRRPSPAAAPNPVRRRRRRRRRRRQHLLPAPGPSPETRPEAHVTGQRSKPTSLRCPSFHPASGFTHYKFAQFHNRLAIRRQRHANKSIGSQPARTAQTLRKRKKTRARQTEHTAVAKQRGMLRAPFRNPTAAAAAAAKAATSSTQSSVTSI